MDDVETFRRVRLQVFNKKFFSIELWDTLIKRLIDNKFINGLQFEIYLIINGLSVNINILLCFGSLPYWPKMINILMFIGRNC